LPHLWPTGSSWELPHRLRPGTSPQALQIPPHGGHPALRSTASGGFRSVLAVSSFRLRARLDLSIPSAFSGQRGCEPRFLGYGAPHLSAKGTLTLLNNALLSAHFATVRLPANVHAGLLAHAPSPAGPLHFSGADRVSRFSRAEFPCMPGSKTSQSPVDACDFASIGIAFRN
jgi:hypothetical protein